MRMIVTAGPTREPLDPVRFLSNRSTGKMGFAIAREAKLRGWDVTLISGPVVQETPAGVTRVDVETVLEMLAALEMALPGSDALVMVAAVSDWRPASVSRNKLKKADMSGRIELVPNPDILCECREGKGNRIHVGFAAETDDLRNEALRKLRSKGLDMIVANNVEEDGSGFSVDTNRVTFYESSGNSSQLPLMSKQDVGRRIVEWIESCASAR